MGFVRVCGFGRCRLGIVFNCIDRTQRSLPSRRLCAILLPPENHPRPPRGRFSHGRGIPHLMVRGIAGRVKHAAALSVEIKATGTLLFVDLRSANIGEESRVGCPATGVVYPGLIQSQRAVDRHARLRRIFVFLAVILPPADRAQSERPGRSQRPASATGASVERFHVNLDGLSRSGLTGQIQEQMGRSSREFLNYSSKSEIRVRC